MIAALLLAAAAPAGVTLHCVGNYDSDRPGADTRAEFDISFSQAGKAVRDVAFLTFGLGALGKWRGRLRDGKIELRLSGNGAVGSLTVEPARPHGTYPVYWDGTYGGGHLYFNDSGKASCTRVTGIPVFEASAI